MRCVALLLICASLVPPAAFAAESNANKDRRSLSRLSTLAATATPLRDAIARGTTREVATRAPRRQPTARLGEPSGAWLTRHPACLGAIVGFVAGFAIGFAAGDDGVFYDFDASFSGLVLGGAGAGVGAIVGWAIGRY